jgi:uncharacterized protein
MQIALTGASGFVGREVIRAATRRGHEVVAFSRDPRRLIHDSIETRRFSTEEPPDFAGCEAIIHLAGENVAGLWTRAKMSRIRDSRVLGTRAVVQGICRSRIAPEVLVCASATGYYGDPGEATVTEEAPPGQGVLSETCQAWEEEARAAESICRVARLRFGLILGRRGGALAVLRRLFRCFLGGRVSSGKQWWSWIHVEDAAALLLFAAENLDTRGAINAVAPWPARNAEFTRVLAKVLRRPAILPVPAWALRFLLRGFSRELLDSRRVVPAAATHLGFPFRFPDLAGALADAVS